MCASVKWTQCGSIEIHSIQEAKTNLPRLVERVRNGEEIVIGKAGDPVAKLVPFDRGGALRRGGQWRGQVRIADDFDEFPAALEAAFAGRDD